MQSSNTRVDAGVAVALLVAGCLLGASYTGAARRVTSVTVTSAFNHRVFGAALMSACGRGMTTPAVPIAAAGAPANQTALIDFLAMRRQAIDWLLGALYGVSLALTYLLCRAAMGRTVSLAMAALFMISPLHLTNLPDLRDYAKVPFFLASLLIVALLVTRRRSAAATVGLAAFAGALVGCGFGVRTDVAINLVIVL